MNPAQSVRVGITLQGLLMVMPIALVVLTTSLHQIMERVLQNTIKEIQLQCIKKHTA